MFIAFLLVSFVIHDALGDRLDAQKVFVVDVAR
jgi:hypothetical protein